jgi:TonB family protein
MIIKKHILFTSVIILGVGVAAFGCMNKPDTENVPNCKVQERGYNPAEASFISGNFKSNRKINRNEDVFYTIRGKQEKPVTITIVKEAKRISDIFPEYPANWISDYKSVVFQSMQNNKEVSILGTDDIITSEQFEMLSNLKIADSFKIIVTYNRVNSITKEVSEAILSKTLTIVPEYQAEYVGGAKEMQAFLMHNSKGQFTIAEFENLESARVEFTVNPNGKINNIQISTSTGSTDKDEFIRSIIQKMPDWKPALNSDSVPVKQQFVFVVSNEPDAC